MGTKNQPGDYDCFAAAAPDEPIFTLLGRDRHAALLVRIWAILRHRSGEEDIKVAEALGCADAMDVYARSLGKNPVDHEGTFEPILIAATSGMEDHPSGYEHACDCDECRSIAD